MGVSGAIGDTSFEAGQKASAAALGDSGTMTTTGFNPDWLFAFKGEVHGVFLVRPHHLLMFTSTCRLIELLRQVTGDSEATVELMTGALHTLSIGTINVVLNVNGNVRPGKQRGHEHFVGHFGFSSSR